MRGTQVDFTKKTMESSERVQAINQRRDLNVNNCTAMLTSIKLNQLNQDDDSEDDLEEDFHSTNSQT